MTRFDQRRRQMLRGTLATLAALAWPALFGCGKRETPPEPAPPAASPEAGTSPTAPPTTTPTKVTQSSVQYQNQPKADQKCSTCMQFVAPDACKVVEGPINPEGWCILWAKKA